MTVALAGPESSLEGLRALAARCPADVPGRSGVPRLPGDDTAVELGAPRHGRPLPAPATPRSRLEDSDRDHQQRPTGRPDPLDLTADQLVKTIFVFAAGLLGTFKVLADMIDAEEMVESALALVAPG